MMSTLSKLALSGLFFCVPFVLDSQNLNQFIQLLPVEDGLVFGINKTTSISSLSASPEGLYILTRKDGCYLLSGETMAQLDQLAVPTDRRDLFKSLLSSNNDTYLWSNSRELLSLDEPSAERVPFIGEHFAKNVSAKVIDIDEAGRVYVGTANDGLFLFHKDEYGGYTDIPLRISTFDNQLPNNTVNCLYRDKEGILWVGTDGGVAIIKDEVVINLSKPKVSKQPNWWDRLWGITHEVEGFNEAVQVITAWGDCVLMANKESLYKANLVDSTLGKFYHYGFNDRLSAPLEQLSAMMVDLDGNIWLAGDQLLRYNITKDQLNRLSENLPFRGRGFRSLAQDYNTGSIWIGTERGGLYEFYENNTFPQRSTIQSTTKF